jgi:ankyrin repeat protein
MADLNDIIVLIELHSTDGIRKCFSEGLDPNMEFRNVPLIYELISEYTRSPLFKDCVKAFVDYGLKMDDKILLAVLTDDHKTLRDLLENNPGAISEKYSLRSAYTPLEVVTLLHICAEFNHRSCAEVLIQYGADVNAKAGTDQMGFGGQTPIFHTVNQNGNQSADMLDLLLSQSADLKTVVKGIIWGKGYEWETFIPSVNAISYAMMGLLPQMHRNEVTIHKTVSVLMKHAYGIDYFPENVPCKYLNK